MLQLLLQLDKLLFIYINHLPHNIILDSFFSFLTGAGYWGLIWFVIGITIFILEEIKDKKGLLALILSGIITLFLVELGLKNIINRARPEFVIPGIIDIFDKTNSYSFPSGHATMAFAAAYILAKKHKKWAFHCYLLAILISFSRIYLGKHYPSDVIVGALLGLFIGFISIKIVKKLAD